MHFEYQYQGKTYSIDVECPGDGRVLAMLDGRRVEASVTYLPNDTLRLTIGDQTYTVYTAKQHDQRYLQVGDAEYSLVIGRRRHPVRGQDALIAQMPGQVTGVLTQAGDVVQRGQTLFILEAMKLETRITAPFDGRVRQLFVHQGDVVQRGQPLADLEADGDPDRPEG